VPAEPPPPPEPPPVPDPLPPQPINPIPIDRSNSSESIDAKRCCRWKETSISAKRKRALNGAELVSQRDDRLFLLLTAAAPRGLVVTDTVPMLIPVASGYEVGFTEHVVAFAGTAQDTLTVEENPKNGVTPRSLI